MRNKYVFTAVLLLVLTAVGAGIIKAGGSSGNAGAGDGLRVVTSFYPVYIAAKNVIGDTEEIMLENLTEPKTGCLHDYQLTPEDMVVLSKADLFFINGGGIESFVDDVLNNYPELPVVTASEGIPYLDTRDGVQTIGHGHEEEDHLYEAEADYLHGEAEPHLHEAEADYLHEEAEPHLHEAEADYLHEEAEPHLHEAENIYTSEPKEADTHDHGAVNAHVWMDVSRYEEEVKNIAAAMAAADPVNAGEYEANTEAYLKKLEILKAELETLKGKASGRKIIIFHDSFAYFADAFGLDIAYMIDMDENTSLSANEVSQLVELVRKEHIDMLFAEEQYGTKIADAVSRETDASVYVLDSLVTGEDDCDSYIRGMEFNLEQLSKAFGEEE